MDKLARIEDKTDKATEIANTVLKLREDVVRAQRLRAEAEGTLNVSKTKLEEVDAGLRKLGIDPEKADVELQALEVQLEQTVRELQASVTAEIQAYNEIIKVSKAAQ